MRVAQPPETTTPAPTVAAISPADIAIRADIDERFLRDVTLRAGQPDPTRPLEGRLAALAAGIGGLEERLRETVLRTLPVGRLESRLRPMAKGRRIPPEVEP